MPDAGLGGRRRQRWLVPLIALAVLVTAGGVAAGALSGDDPSPNLSALEANEAVIADGTSPVAGSWRLTSVPSKESAGQPGGLPCIRLVFNNPPADTPLAGSEFCGQPSRRDGLMAGSVPVKDFATGKTELFIFGRAAAGAVNMELENASGESIRSSVKAAGSPDATWVLIVPESWQDGELYWRDADDIRQDAKYATDGFFDRLEAMKRMPRRG